MVFVGAVVEDCDHPRCVIEIERHCTAGNAVVVDIVRMRRDRLDRQKRLLKIEDRRSRREMQILIAGRGDSIGSRRVYEVWVCDGELNVHRRAA